MGGMWIRTILVLTDLEEASLVGLRTAYALAKRKGAKLVVGHVLVPRTLDPSNVKEFLGEHGLDPEAATIDIEVDADVMSGIDLLEQVKRLEPDTVVIIMTSHASLDTAQRAVRAGAFDYLVKPFEELDAISQVTGRAVENIPVPSPAMMFVAAPVLEASAILWAGPRFSAVKYSVRSPIATPAARPKIVARKTLVGSGPMVPGARR